MIDTEKILHLLGTGLSSEVVATAVGCDPSYISQLLADEDFRNKVTERRLVSLTSATTRDQKYDTLEDRLLDKLDEVVQYITKPREVIAALAAMNKMERRGGKPQEQVTINNKIVNLVLPERVAMQFTTNSHQQVVGVNGKSMLTLDSRRLPELAGQKKALTSISAEDVQPQKLQGTIRDETSGNARAPATAPVRGSPGSPDFYRDEDSLLAALR